jgi:adenine-specific DNA-methyltransferase
VSRVSGIPPDWQRSRYNRRQHAAAALFDAVARCRAAFLLISYNSEGFIPHADFRRRMRAFGRLRVLATHHPTFRGSRNLRQRPTHVTEYLYLLERR